MTSSNPYGYRASGGRHGDVFTTPEVVKYMLDLVGYIPEHDLSHIKILEPSCGEGEFIVEIAQRLIDSSRVYQFDPITALNQCVLGYDIDPEKVNRCKQRVKALGLDTDFLQIKVGNFLLDDISQTVDVVIGNPPYIRYENIPEPERNYYKNHYRTFHYRADLYIPFFEKSLSLLKPSGKHCFICSNRWLKNEYGKKLRHFIAIRYRLESILNLEKANAFQENVLAYPAITLISNLSPNNKVNYAKVEDTAGLRELSLSQKVIHSGDDWSHIFNEATNNTNLCYIEELGFKIGIGVATGADRIFISNRLPQIVEPELLLPAINVRDLKGDQMNWNGEYLLNPYQPNGELINLARYPKAAHYLEQHKDLLSKRHIAKKNAAKWYKTIDRIIPGLQHENKILLPDMSSNRYIFIDEGKYYPLHNLYYIKGLSLRELKVLSAFLISDEIRTQICNITNNMNGGFPRWQSQYLRKLRIPDIRDMNHEECEALIRYYEQRDFESINKLVKLLFEKTHIKPSKQRHKHEVMSISFDYTD